MALKKSRKAKGNVVSVDFTGVKAGGATVPDGRYKAKITAVEQKEGKESGEPYIQATWEITSNKCNGREVLYDNYSLQPSALWKLKGMLEAMGVEVPDGEQDVDFDELISDETECIIEIVGEKSPDGDRTYARVTGCAPLEDGNTVDDEDENEEDDPKPKKRGTTSGKTSKPARGKPADDDDEEEDDEEDDEPPKRRGKAKPDEDEDEEDDPPPRAAGKKLKKGARVKFKDEKNKLTKGEIESIDGETATVVSDADDTYEIDVSELTAI